MSSSANRRPRVAGQRPRPARDGGSVGPRTPDEGTTPEGTEPEAAPSEDSPEDEGPDGPGAGEDSAADSAGTSGEAATSGGPGRAVDEEVSVRSVLLPAAALALCLMLLATVFFVTRDDPGERPRAAAAATATARSTLEQALSYNHATMTKQLPVTQELLTGTFKTEFGETMTKTIVPLAQKDKTVVKARVYEAGVMSQTADTVTVQAFVNQAKTSDAQKEPSIDQNRVIATMTKVGNRWLVSALKAY